MLVRKVVCRLLRATLFPLRLEQWSLLPLRPDLAETLCRRMRNKLGRSQNREGDCLTELGENQRYNQR